MRSSLARWIGDAEALLHLEHFRVRQQGLQYTHISNRADDYYLSLVGDLFERMRDLNGGDPNQWARLGNALAQFAEAREEHLRAIGVPRYEAALFAAVAFYYGGFPASAHLTIKRFEPGSENETYLTCFDFLARPSNMASRDGRLLIGALRRGDMKLIAAFAANALDGSALALRLGPNEWVPARLLEQLMKRFVRMNVRAVLPDGASDFWTPLVSSLLNRKPPTWEFFPSQIEAIERGLLVRNETFSLQMPTGAGKTTLCETLLYWHAKRDESAVAVLLVPYRSLASELRATLVKRLNQMGISARCAYGGTVPTGDEVRGLDDTRVIVATPESLSGLLSAEADFFRRISLVICDEGHLLDGAGRGIGLELLLARMMARDSGPPRFVFLSAIVPNIEEINSWLGGSRDGVVRSEYRPALAEFSVLRPSGSGASMRIALDVHPHEPAPTRYTIAGFLGREDFQWTNPDTGRTRTSSFGSVKAQAIAAARKALPMGAAAVFAANKRGRQGAVGLAEELLAQLRYRMPLPEPSSFVIKEAKSKVDAAVDYLKREYGDAWVGTQALAVGAVLHHGDIPQETREIVEALLRQEYVRLAICTSTLAEGVNLPIRTLVLYSVRRQNKDGTAEDLLTRDIKNLVGRAGRAGATTKGLVICANQKQWPLVEQIARQAPGEPVRGALLSLVQQLSAELALHNLTLTNQILEAWSPLHSLVDGVDATLIDLAAEEIGEDALVQIAIRIADQTFAARQADAASKQLLREVFAQRARRVLGVRSAGRLGWMRETGARMRMLDSVESDLLPRRASWDDVSDPIDPSFVMTMLAWVWAQDDLQQAVRKAYEVEDAAGVRQSFTDLVRAWIAGRRFTDMATDSGLPIDTVLRVHAGTVTFTLQTLIEQGIALLSKLLESQGQALAPAVVQFPEHLRFGAPTTAAHLLAGGGVRHRSAAVSLGLMAQLREASPENRRAVYSTAREFLLGNRAAWESHLGSLVFENTLLDLSSMVGAEDQEDEEP